MAIIGISGKIGSGKNYLSEKIKEELARMGYSTSEASFASTLKDELTSIIKTVNVSFLDSEDASTTIDKMIALYELNYEQANFLYTLILEDLKENKALNGYARTENIRRALQYLGTDVRRKQDEQYWVKACLSSVPSSDYVLITDVRFPNEADAIVNTGGVMIRLEVSNDIIKERVKNRDGFKYSESALTHPSEIALDNYDKFNLFVNETFDTKEVVSSIINAVHRFVQAEKYGV
jgi:hypothetical protein